MSHDRFLKPAGWVTIAMAILSPAGALGYDFRLVPSLAAREGYNSNIYFTPQDRVDSWITRVAPGLDVSGRTERLDAAAGGNLIWWWYSADSNLNTVDYDVRGRAAYRVTDTFRASATGEYRKESSPDRIFEDTGVVQNFQVDYRQDYTASAEVALSEKAAATLSYAYQQVEYPDRPFQDFTYHTADLGFAYNLSRFGKATKGRLDLGFGRGLYEGLTVNDYTATVGVFRAVHELWSTRVGIGGRYTTSTFDVLGQRQESTDWGWVGVLGHEGHPRPRRVGKDRTAGRGGGGNLTWWSYNADSNLNTFDYDVRGRAAYRFSDTFRASATGEYRERVEPGPKLRGHGTGAKLPGGLPAGVRRIGGVRPEREGGGHLVVRV